MSGPELTLQNVPRFPEMLNVEVTSACQLHCRYCPRDDMTREHGEMDIAVFERIVDECTRYDTRLWLHYMGDPLLHSGIYDMLTYAKRAGLSSVGMSTNVLLLTADAGRKLISTGLDRLELSLDAADARQYRRLRASDKFDKVVNNAKTFFAVRKETASSKPVVTLSFMDVAENRRDWPRIARMWKPYLQGEDFIMSIAVHSFAGTIKEVSNQPVANHRSPCPALWRSTLVLWNGDVTICSMDADGKTVLGNVTQQSLESIWHSNALNELRNKHVENNIPDDSLCAGCTDWQLLQAGYAKIRS